MTEDLQSRTRFFLKLRNQITKCSVKVNDYLNNAAIVLTALESRLIPFL